MLSPARRHFLRAASGIAASLIAPGKKQTGDQFELMAAALWESRRTLKAIKSLDNKIAKKRELLEQFTPYIAGVLESGQGAQDDVLMTCMVWLLDTGSLASALDIAEYALKHGLETPDHYQRDTPSLLAEQIADEALRRLAGTFENDEARTFVAVGLLQDLLRAEQLIDGKDMHDQIRAKLYKAIGYAYRDKQGHTADALASLQKALALNERVGVKKDIEKLQRELTNQNKNAEIT